MTRTHNFLRSILIIFVALSFSLSAPAQTNTDDKDPLLDALKTELARSKAKLQLDKEKRPFFIEYTVTAAEDYSADAVFGALRRENATRIRLLRVEVRVGDYKQDSSFGQGDGVSDLVPLDDDPIAIRHQVWLATDSAYKRAIEALTEKQAMLKQIEVEYQVDDFAPATAVTSIAPLRKLEFGGEEGRKRWIAMVVNASGVFRKDDKLQSFSAALSFTVLNRYLVNTEGSTVRTGQESYTVNVSGTTQATDGMRLDRNKSFSAAHINELLKPDEFLLEANKLVQSLAALRNAPVVDDQYQGPVLFSPDAAADVFHDLVGNNALGRRPRLGSPARTTTDFANYFRSRVLPEFMTVTDDPTMSVFKGQSLLGHYDVDEEGVTAKPVTLVDKGKLVNYLLGRTPIRDFPASNGHARGAGGGPPGPAMSNLIVSTTEPIAPAELDKRLIEMCKDRGLAFGYYVETLGGLNNPRLLYRVWVKDGRRELVRGARFGDLDRRTLRSSLAAAGNDAALDNRGFGVPISIITPSILIDEMEVRRDNATKEKLPQYPPPALTTVTKTGN